ncbi:MAG: hypothetical protein COX57_06825 [Alphaproteobacteria bacterium CG_4_10_14_0_2_um_filter_63_37]|nr:MAG: hypothetical protein AUJ55_06775 [Proteobacteria bacterium CG1_02_64_396]PJA24711.1 MAG: hypothetical protein COX57_06825 [Alphaproteobacteria bacterium CG_4_10_14_0_2_um_filter_63_37]
MLRRMTMLVLAVMALPWAAQAGDELSPYLALGNLSAPIEQAADQVAAAAQGAGLTVVGRYHPGGDAALEVVVVTAPAWQQVAKNDPLRGFAAVLKVGLKAQGEKIAVSALNPEYLMRAYLQEDFAAQSQAVAKPGQALVHALSDLTGAGAQPFGGAVDNDDLADYHYMFAMPYFEDVVDLATFPSLRQGIETVRRNLAAGSGKTQTVFEVALPDGGALFGVGLLDPEAGESHFLPIIGSDHVAAMPYDLLVTQYKGKARALMLHGL